MVANISEAQREAPVYNIKAVSHTTGVPADTLRRWESRYGVIRPQRTEGGYRLYSQKDVEVILWLKERLEDGLSISRACEMLRQMGGDIGRGLQAMSGSAGQGPARAGAVDFGAKSFEALQIELVEAFTRVDEERAGAVLTEALSLYSLEEVLLEIAQPALVKVGEGWLRAEISVAVEHFASAFMRTRLSNILHSSRHNPHGPLVLVTCGPEEFHELGPLFLAVFLRRGGYRVVYLGQNTPLASLERMVEAMRPDALCVSATRAESAARLYTLHDFMDDLGRRKGSAPLLAFGGQFFNKFPHIAERLSGMYLGADAAQAVQHLGDALNAARRAS